MSKQTVLDADKMAALKSDYLTATIMREEALARWKMLERRRRFLVTLMVLTAIVGVIAAALVWFPYRTNAADARGFLYASLVLAASLAIILAFALFRAATTVSARATYLECHTSELAVEESADAIKAATLDPALGNTLIISARSVITASPYEYNEEAIDHPEASPASQGAQKISKYKKAESAEQTVFRSPVNSAVVYIDGKEIASLDLAREFSVFRVSPGIHTVKLKLCKHYSVGKEITIETSPATVMIDSGYRILLYTIDAHLENGKLTYALKLSEYDDVTTFRRDALDTDRKERLEREADLTPYLEKRAQKLYSELYEQKRYKELLRAQEARRYERDKHRWVGKDDSIPSDELLREYRKKAKEIGKKMLIAEADPTLSEQSRAKALRALDKELSALARNFYEDICKNTNAPTKGYEEARLKSILLFGQETVRYEDIARKLHHEAL